ncbi:expansin EXLX1 family cellulose-binding protein [Streptomyces sediminimaris]|uniref:expansin EXLX1 family cellulose-binding protein n=1 Tax=Streptomyces sediminimaris TaxID=3383721 RepID=UPI00399C46F1
MNAPRRAARQRRRRRTLIPGAISALTATAFLAYLAVAPHHDRDAHAGPAAAAATPPAAAHVRATTETGTPAATANPTGTSSPPTAATTTSAPPSPTETRRPPRTSVTTSPAGRIRPGTAYQAGDGDGACLYGPSRDLMIAAMNTTDYETSRMCGAYVLVRAANGNSVTVRVTNECPLPCAPGQPDLSEQAFAKLAALKTGRVPITWSLVSPRTTDTISIRYKTGSSPYWCAIQTIGQRNPVTALEVRTANGWRRLPRTAYDYFVAADGSGCGKTIRITDIYGERLTISGIAVRSDVVQPTRAQSARH